MPAGVSKASAGSQGAARQRRAAHFWSPLNDWWRAYLAERGRRPVTTEVQAWYAENADAVWGDGKPSWKEARIHAKCLRSTEQVKNYFRAYRARSKGVAYTPEESNAKGGKGAARRGQRSEPTATGDDSAAEDCPEEEDGSGPSSADFAAEPFHATAGATTSGGAPLSASAVSTPLANELLHASMNPATITTGNGVPTAWQQRSASERFPAGSRPQLFDGSSGGGASGGAPEPLPGWERSQSSVVFRPPSLAVRTKPLSPFVLTQVKREADADAATTGLDPTQQQQAPTAAPPAVPGSPMLSVATKSQSFSASTKRRHTTEDTYGPCSSATPAMLRQAASFSHGHGHPAPHPHYPHPHPHQSHHQQRFTAASHSPHGHACGAPYMDGMSGAPGGYGNGAAMYAPGPAPLTNPQTVRYTPRLSSDLPPGSGRGLASRPSWDGSGLQRSPSMGLCYPGGGMGAQGEEHVEPPAEPEPAHSSLMRGVDRNLVEHIARDAAARSSYLQRTASGTCGEGGAGAGAPGGGLVVGMPVTSLPPRSASGTARPGPGMMGGTPPAGQAHPGMSSGPLPLPMAPHVYDAAFADWLALPEYPEDVELSTLGHGSGRHSPYPYDPRSAHHTGVPRQHPAMSDPGASPASLRSLSFPMAHMPHANQGTGGPRRPHHLPAVSPGYANAARMRGAPLPPSAQAALLHAHDPLGSSRPGQPHSPAQPQHPSTGGQRGGMGYGYVTHSGAAVHTGAAVHSGNSGSPGDSGADPSSSSWAAAHSQDQGQGQGGQQRGQGGPQGQGLEPGPLSQVDSVGLPFHTLRVHSASVAQGQAGEGGPAGQPGQCQDGSWGHEEAGPVCDAWVHGDMEWEHRMADEVLGGGLAPVGI